MVRNLSPADGRTSVKRIPLQILPRVIYAGTRKAYCGRIFYAQRMDRDILKAETYHVLKAFCKAFAVIAGKPGYRSAFMQSNPTSNAAPAAEKKLGRRVCCVRSP